MTSVNEAPIFKAPKKRTKKGQPDAVNFGSHCYDVIKTFRHDEHKQGPQNVQEDLLLKHSPMQKNIQVSPRKRTEKSQNIIPTHQAEFSSINLDFDTEAASEKSALNDTKSQESFVTMTGTIKRGKKAGQNMDVRLNMSREELENLEASFNKPKNRKTQWSFHRGFHIIFLSILSCPLAAILSGSYSFYLGTLTWYNFYLFYNEERTIWHKIFVCPLLLFLYPFLIVLSTLGLAIFGAVSQISWNFDRWLAEFQDYEKGFFGWFCGIVGLDDCAPYEVIILNESSCEGIKVPENDTAL
uniref:Transmembrane protein 169 n=1 Tax=Strigamia maritima TaxID=126957 RepID=T1JJW6_STRMM